MVRGGVERSPSKAAEKGHAVQANSCMAPGETSQLDARRVIGNPVSNPDPAPHNGGRMDKMKIEWVCEHDLWVQREGTRRPDLSIPVVRLEQVHAALAAKDQQLEECNMRRRETIAMCDQLTQELARMKGEVDGWRETAKTTGDVDHHGLALSIADLKQARADLLKEAVGVIKGFMGPMEKRGEWDDGCFYYNTISATELQEPIQRAQAFLRTQEGDA